MTARTGHDGASPSGVPARIARRVADAVLYRDRSCAAPGERPGTLVPPGRPEEEGTSWSLTECLLERAQDASVHLCLRFLHLRRCGVERAGTGAGEGTFLSCDETTEREVGESFPLAVLLAGERTAEVNVPGDRFTERIRGPHGAPEGRVICEHLPLNATLTASAERLAGPYGLIRLRVLVRNTALLVGREVPGEYALGRSLLSAHLIVETGCGGFVSLADPPEWAGPFARACRNEHTWPALVGEPGHRDVVLSSPVVLPDHPDDPAQAGDEEAIA
ncbi:hypothetical protein ACFY19_05180 [Streptosporangium saharense]|uniref:hypothetical protein n=1 Tax=Streptosporangium saharense TaxID=1706840 RepID=UPI0036C9B5BD